MAAGYTEKVLLLEEEAKYSAGYRLSGVNNLATFYNGSIISCDTDLSNRRVLLEDVKSSCFGINETGNIYLLINHYDDNNKLSHTNRSIGIYDPAGKYIRSITLESTKKIDTLPPSQIIVKQENMYIVYSSGVQIVNNEGITITEIVCGSSVVDIDIDAAGNVILIRNEITIDQKQFREKYDKNTGRAIWSILSEIRPVNQRDIYYNHSDNKIFITYDYFINIYDSKGMCIGRLIDFSNYKIMADALDGYNVYNAMFFADQTIFIEIRNSMKHINKIIQFKYDSDKNTGNDNQINNKIELFVNHIQKSDLDKIAKYELQNPGVKININTYFGDLTTSLRSKEDYIQSINLMIMSGEKWDILATSYYSVVVPYKKYINMKLLLDLNEVDKDNMLTDNEKYFQNIFNAYREEGKMYIFPVALSFNSIALNKDLIQKYKINDETENWTWNDFIDIAQMLSINGDVKMFDSNETPPKGGPIHTLLYNLTYPAIINEIVDYNKRVYYPKALSDVLDMIDRLSSTDYFNRKGEQSFVRDLYIITKYSSTTITGASNPNISTISDLIRNARDEELIPASLPKYGDSTGRGFRQEVSFAINNASKLKDESFTFLKYYAENSALITASRELFNKCVESKDLPDDLINKVERIIENLTYEQYAEFDILKIEDVMNFINRSITKQEIVETVSNKAWLYLKE